MGECLWIAFATGFGGGVSCCPQVLHFHELETNPSVSSLLCCREQSELDVGVGVGLKPDGGYTFNKYARNTR